MDVYEWFKTDEFKNLPYMKRVWIRFKVAFFETISMQ
jgi:hypothetical protein